MIYSGLVFLIHRKLVAQNNRNFIEKKYNLGSWLHKIQYICL